MLRVNNFQTSSFPCVGKEFHETIAEDFDDETRACQMAAAEMRRKRVEWEEEIFFLKGKDLQEKALQEGLKTYGGASKVRARMVDKRRTLTFKRYVVAMV